MVFAMKVPLVSARLKAHISFQHLPPRLVRWGFHPSSLGSLLIGVDADSGALCLVAFAKGRGKNMVANECKAKWSKTQFVEDNKLTAAMLKSMFARPDALKVQMTGTPFQHAVWKAIAAIPAGKTMTYADLARKIKNPKAVRAAGTACGANPVPVVVPCHRVVGSNGGLGGFGGGLELKRLMLDAEKRAA